MGMAVLESAISAGLNPVPLSLGGPEDAGKIVQVGGKEIKVHGTSERERILSSMYEEYPNLIVVDYTVPDAVNGTMSLSCGKKTNICIAFLCLQTFTIGSVMEKIILIFKFTFRKFIVLLNMQKMLNCIAKLECPLLWALLEVIGSDYSRLLETLMFML